MSIFNLFSSRNPEEDWKARFPEKVRTQVFYPLRDCIGAGVQYSDGAYNPVWWNIRDQLVRELGLTQLTGKRDPMDDCAAYFMHASDLEAANLLDLAIAKADEYLSDQRHIVQLTLGRSLSHAEYLENEFGAKATLDDAVVEINARLRQGDVPLQFARHQLVRTDSNYLHQNVTEPAFELLHDNRFDGAEHELKRAHNAYLQGRWDDAISEANQAFESAMKHALEIEGGGYDPGDTAGVLVKKVVDSSLFAGLDEHYRGKLKHALAAKLPPLRNPLDHGAGAKPREGTQELAAHALHIAAADIVLVVSALGKVRASRR